MTVPTTIDAGAWFGNYLQGADGDGDLARAMLKAFSEAVMSAQASAQCGAAYGERTEERENTRNGYRTRPWDTRVGTIELQVPKLRQGVYSPEFLLSPRRRAEQALVAVICQAYVEGVSTRRVDDLVKAMGIEGISKSEVSRLAAELDQRVAEFKNRPLSSGPYRYLWIDALTQRVREGGRVVNVSLCRGPSCQGVGSRRQGRVLVEKPGSRAAEPPRRGRRPLTPAVVEPVIAATLGLVPQLLAAGPCRLLPSWCERCAHLSIAAPFGGGSGRMGDSFR